MLTFNNSATYADDTALLTCNKSLEDASKSLQESVKEIEKWLKKWNIKVNTQKSINITFALRKGECQKIELNGMEIPQSNCVKYLGMHIDKRLTWKDHIKMKRKQLTIKTKKMQWLLGPQSALSLENRLLIYKVILKPVWTYGIQLWGTASNSNLEVLQRYQSKTLREICRAPWFVTNQVIHRDLNIPFIKEEVNKFSTGYLDRLSNHTNTLAISLLDDSFEIIRLKRHHILDLPFRR